MLYNIENFNYLFDIYVFQCFENQIDFGMLQRHKKIN